MAQIMTVENSASLTFTISAHKSRRRGFVKIDDDRLEDTFLLFIALRHQTLRRNKNGRREIGDINRRFCPTTRLKNNVLSDAGKQRS